MCPASPTSYVYEVFLQSNPWFCSWLGKIFSYLPLLLKGKFQNFKLSEKFSYIFKTFPLAFNVQLLWFLFSLHKNDGACVDWPRGQSVFSAVGKMWWTNWVTHTLQDPFVPSKDSGISLLYSGLSDASFLLLFPFLPLAIY